MELTWLCMKRPHEMSSHISEESLDNKEVARPSCQNEKTLRLPENKRWARYQTSKTIKPKKQETAPQHPDKEAKETWQLHKRMLEQQGPAFENSVSLKLRSSRRLRKWLKNEERVGWMICRSQALNRCRWMDPYTWAIFKSARKMNRLSWVKEMVFQSILRTRNQRAMASWWASRWPARMPAAARVEWRILKRRRLVACYRQRRHRRFTK